MNTITAEVGPAVPTARDAPEAAASGVSWGAVFAGAAGAAALSLILVVLGTGLGLSALSPWTGRGTSAEAISTAGAVWLAFTQLAAAGVGGYLAGRLRTKWAALHTDEVYFRDTAHGFIAWSVATLVTAALLGSAVAAALDATARAAGATVGAASAITAVADGSTAAGRTEGPEGAGQSTAPGSSMGQIAYFVDSLFRADIAQPAQASQQPVGQTAIGNAESGRIFVQGLAVGMLPPADSQYLAQIVALRTGLSSEDAQKRVDETFNRAKATLRQARDTAKEAADKARATAAKASLWLFVSLLIGAFVASLSATWGGRSRDLV